MTEQTPADLPFSKQAQVGRSWNCRAESPGCTRKAPCRSCLGRRNRRSGLAKQRAARKALGVPASRVASAASNEENWRHVFRWEVKSGQLARSAATRYLEAEAQGQANKAEGDPRPFAMILMPKGWGNEGLVLMRLSTWRGHVAPELETPA